MFIRYQMKENNQTFSATVWVISAVKNSSKLDTIRLVPCLIRRRFHNSPGRVQAFIHRLESIAMR